MADGDFDIIKALAAKVGIEIQESPHLTDKGNAALFATLHKDDLRYCWPTKDFYWWDGARWSRDEHGKAEWWSRDVAHKYYEMAAALNTQAADLNTKASTETDSKESLNLADSAMKSGGIAKAYTAWAKKSEASERMASIVRWARSEPGISIQPTDLDVDHWLLNCLNGTLDLRTGELREHRREDLITKVCPVEYDPDAKFLLWDQFLERIQPRAEMRHFLRKGAGYTATGFTTEEKLFFCHGDTSTGKSTFLQAIRTTLGDYATTADFDAFLQSDRASGHKEHIARLAGKRMVVSIEVDEGQKMAEALIKHLTGGESVTASFKFGNTFEFFPSFQLWLAANHRPRVRADDNAIWRRILQLPFEVVIPEEERDPGVKATLTDLDVAGPAILAWIVEGCLDWQREGLLPPQEVQQATVQYRQEMDPLSDFIEERCEKDDDVKGADNGDLYKAYQSWAEEVGIRRPLGRKSFTQAMQANGFEQRKENHGKTRYWPGLAITGAATQRTF